MKGVRAAALACALLALGCGATFDLERVREVVRGTPRPEMPVLHETPPATLPAPTGLHAASGQLRQVPLTWDPLPTAAAEGYVIERSLAAAGPFERIGVRADRFQTSLSDQGFDLGVKSKSAAGGPGLGDGATYYYRVRAFDSSGHISASASEVATAVTAAPPNAPEAVRAFSQLPRKIALAWQPIEDPNVTSYLVLRSPSATGSFEQVARLEGRFSTTWVDHPLGDLQVFYYKVVAVNAAGGKGTPSEAVRAVTKANPLAPAGVQVVAQSLGRNVLSWTPNVEKDVIAYRILRRRADGEPPEVVASLSPDITTVEDKAVGAGETVSYSLVALDSDGLQSEESDPIEVTSRGYDLRAVPGEGGVVLTWAREPEDGFVRARIERSGMIGRKAIAESEGGRYVDRDVSPGRTYTYVVVLQRPDGTSAPPSAPVEVDVPDD